MAGLRSFEDRDERCCFVDDLGTRCPNPPLVGSGRLEVSACAGHLGLLGLQVPEPDQAPPEAPPAG